MVKPILDVSCGGRMMWFDKNHPNVVYADRRKETHKLSNGATLVINPDVFCDFTKLPFASNSFYLVVFDPPHLRGVGKTGWMIKKYGSLDFDWKEVLRAGINESMRVLKEHGTLIFKWNETHFRVSEVIAAIGRQPLFGHRTMVNNKTIWMTFMKGIS